MEDKNEIIQQINDLRADLESVKSTDQERLAEIYFYLGIKYWKLSERVNKEANLTLSIEAFHQALGIFTKEGHPYDYAKTQMNLANAYLGLSEVRDKEANWNQAIEAFNQALEIFTEEEHPYDYAETHMNLVNALIG